MAPHRLAHHPVAGAFLNIGSRVVETPALGWIGAALASFFGAMWIDPFTWAWLLLVLFSAGDHSIGVQRAKETPGAYRKEERARGRREKVTTALLMLGCRAVEGWATSYGLLDLGALLRFIGLDDAASSEAVRHGGIVSAVITILIALGELKSIYGHRLADGGSRILLLELVFRGVSAAQAFVLGRATKVTAAIFGKEETAAKEWVGELSALRRMDEQAHATAHGGEMAPGRRHYDVALEDAAEDGIAPPGTPQPPPPRE